MMTERYADRESTDPIGTDAPTTRLFIDERDAGTLEPRTSLGTLSDADVLLVRPERPLSEPSGASHPLSRNRS